MPCPLPQLRRRVRWGLRDLMIAVLVVGGPMGWMAHVIRTQRAALAAMAAERANLWFDYEADTAPVAGGSPPADQAEPSAPAWVRRWLGDELFQSVLRVEMVAPSDEATWQHLARFRDLESLSLFFPEPGGAGLDRLRDLPRLATIELEGPGVDDRVLDRVASFRRVESLDLRGVPAGDAGFASLARLDGVTLAWFADCPNLTDATLARLVACWPRLRKFEVRGAGPGRLTATLAALARHCPDLQELELIGPRVTDADLATIARSSKLTDLDLSETRITDEGTARLRPLVCLKTARFGGTAVADRTLAVASNWPALDELDLRRTAVTGSGLSDLVRLPLRSLDLDGSRLTDAHLSALGAIPTLTHVDLSKLPGVTDEGLAALRPGFAVRRVDAPNPARLAPEPSR